MHTESPTVNARVIEETKRRRTFAIISHPDAGKTTLTEKLLLYGGAIQLAGSVRSRRAQRKATSDWMEIEKQRGISVTSTVLQFDYQGLVLNLLDTPGHDDFSADTYRTLMAADSAVMLIDNAKGVETQTKKLFAICKERGVPIFTFINKLDHEGIGPLALLTEVETTLGIRSVPMNWPIGQGREFMGVCDRETQLVSLFDRVAHGSKRAEEEVLALDDPRLKDRIGEAALSTLIDELGLLDIAGEPIDEARILSGELTPVFFGSALTNFGVELFLNRFIQLAPPPQPRASEGSMVPSSAPFSAFIFKIQANMDPNHRDRIAFMRVVSGQFDKDMEVVNTRTGAQLRLSRPQRLFAQDRETVEEAFPGDIVGLSNPGAFRLGDTLSADPAIHYSEVSTFVPETFCRIHNQDPGRFKHYLKGIEQLCEEGLVDLFYDRRGQRLEVVLGAVGALQFEVVLHRLLGEYGVRANVEPLGYEHIRWVTGPEAKIAATHWGSGASALEDRHGQKVVLVGTEWNLKWLQDQNPDLKFHSTPPLSSPA